MKHILIFLFLVIYGFAAEAKIQKIIGEAYMVKDGKELKLKLGDGVAIPSVVFTKDNSKVVIEIDNNVVVLGKNSSIDLKEKDLVIQKNGNCFYDISPLKKGTKMIMDLNKNRFTVQTKTSTIGIRGTNFIVTTSQNDEKVFLREGELNIASVKAEFQIYVKKEMDEFEAYKKSLEKEFKEFVDTQEYEFSEYKKEFKLEQNRFVYIKDGKVYQEKFTKEVEVLFDDFDQVIK